MNLHDLNIAVLGAGRSGRAAARLAMKHGGRVCVFDTSPATPAGRKTSPCMQAPRKKTGTRSARTWS